MVCGIVVRITAACRSVAPLVIAAALASRPAQSAAQAPPPSPDSTPHVSASVGYEAHRDRMHYGFENPSNIDTPFLVPHRFDQTYVADNQWLVASARYSIFGDVMQTEFSTTPMKATFASDLDTFFDPDDDVVVSGTAGDVSMHSFRVAHWSEARLWGLPWRIGYVYRRDVTEFHSTERLLTHSRPPTESRTPISTHETTISQVQEIPVGVSKQVAMRSRWLLTAGADFSPIASARLTTELPEKYPGQEISFEAKIATLTARAQVDGRLGHWLVTLRVAYGRTWSYRSSEQFSRDSLQGGVQIGLVRSP